MNLDFQMADLEILVSLGKKQQKAEKQRQRDERLLKE
jgi:hypothetical protein